MRLIIVLVCFGFIACPPVLQSKEELTKDGESDDNLIMGLEYERYLREVVDVLEQDEEFRKKLDEANATEIKSGDIAQHLDMVSHSVRTKLDELKRKELDRLSAIYKMMRKNSQRTGMHHDAKTLVGHLDHGNENTFEQEDLTKLIKKATDDLEELDKKRKKEFKHYELEKEYSKREKLKHLDASHRADEEKRMHEMDEKHKKHKKLHHPGSKSQLEEVWEDTDGLKKEEFDPKTFFMLHDTNGDGVLNEQEIEALFQKQLDEVYDPDAPEDDMMERYEEMNRMREHVLHEVDQNNDKLITLAEFLASTKKDDFSKDEGWKTLDDEPMFMEDEMQQYMRQRHKEELQGHAQPGEVNIPPIDNFGGNRDNENVQHMSQEAHHQDNIQLLHNQPPEQQPTPVHHQPPQQEHHQQPPPEHHQQPPPEHHQQPPPEHHRQPPPEHHRQPPREHRLPQDHQQPLQDHQRQQPAIPQQEHHQQQPVP